MDGYIAEIRLFAGNFAPRSWAFCDGQLLEISQHTSLYSVIGDRYGGDGRVTFALPDLRGRVPISAGQAPGLPNYMLGQQGGEPIHRLTEQEMPGHTHQANCKNSMGTQANPGGNVWAGATADRSGPVTTSYDPTADNTMSGDAIGNAGGDQPHNNMQPYLAINYIICLEGMYPDRN